MKVLRVKSVNGDTSFQNETVEVYDKIERILDYRLHHSWSSTQKNTHHLGTDNIEFERIESRLFYDGKSKIPKRYERVITKYSASIVVDSINEENRIILKIYIDGIFWARILNVPEYTRMAYDTKDYGKVKTEEEMRKLDPFVWQYIFEVLKFKEDNAGGSPLQAEAYKNRQYNKNIDTIGMVAKSISTILGYVNHPIVKVGSKIIGVGSSVVTKCLKESDDASSFILDIQFEPIILNNIYEPFLEA